MEKRAYAPSRDGISLVGRAAELADLVAALQSARQGQGAVVGVRADVGMGKSRLKRALVGVAKQLGVRVLEGSSLAAGDAAYGTLGIVIREALHVREGERAEIVRRILHEEGARLDLREADRHHLANVLGVGEPASPLSYLDGRAIRWNNMTAVRALLFALARECPLCVVLEDMHLADGLSREVVDFMAREVGLSRALVLVLYRRGYSPPAYAREILLHALSAEGSAEVLGGLVGRGILPERLFGDIVERSEGNPLYIEEAARYAAESGLDLAVPSRPSPPETLQDLMSARLLLLPPEALRVAEVSAVVGHRFEHDVLARIEELWPHAVTALEELAARDIVLRDSDPGSYAFKSSLMRQVACASIGRARIEAIHGAVAGSLQALRADGAEVEPERIARHWSRAGQRDHAARIYLASARAAAARHAHPDAERLFRAYLGHQPEVTEERVRAHLELARVQNASGWPAEAAESCRFAATHAQEIGDRELLGKSLLELASLVRLMGQTEEAEALLDEAFGLLSERNDRKGQAEVYVQKAVIEKQSGSIDAARALLERALAIHQELGDQAGEAATLSSMASLDHEQRRLGEALAFNERAIVLFRARGDRKSEATVLRNIASIVREQGRLNEARDLYEAAVAVHREVGDRRALGITLGNLSSLHGDQGRLEMALALGEQALRLHREVGNRPSEGAALGYIAAIHHERGDLDSARSFYEQAITILRETRYWPFLAVNLAYLADLFMDMGQPDRARPLLDESLALHARGGSLAEEGLSLLKRARLLLLDGDVTQAIDVGERAVEIERRADDRRGQAIASITLAAAYRAAGRDPDTCRKLLEESAAVLSELGDLLEMVRCLVEQGHQAIQSGLPGRPYLEKAEDLLREVRLGGNAPASRAVASLRSSAMT